MATKPKAPRLPKGLLAEFVRKHYAPGVQAGAYAKFRKNRDLVPIRQASGDVRLTTPQQRRQRPDIFLGDTGEVRGGFRNPNPALNPNDWELAQNRVGITFARPRTEFTGMDPQSVADVKAFDQLTDLQGQRITGAYNQYAEQAAADRDRASQALGDLARLAGSGFSAPQGLGLSAAEMALPGVTAETGTAGSFARSAQTLADMSSLPTVARSEGLSAGERFRAERLGQRQEMLSAIRQAQAEQQAAEMEAQLEADRFNRTLAAQLRGQNLDLLGTMSGQQADMQELLARLQSQAALQGSEHAHEMGLAGLEAQQDAIQSQVRAQQDIIGDTFRNPRQLRTSGFSLGPWRTKPKPRKGITFEQGTNGLWYGKPGKGSARDASSGESRTRALADIQASLGQKIDVKDAAGTVTGQRGLSAYEIAADIAAEYDVPLAWAYDQARRSGFHARKGEWMPSKWKRTSLTARAPWTPGSIARAQLR